ncbi:MAG: hypothetical protein R6V12_18615 [Candidatus Hydrogenedentota bacterium]
MRFALANVTDLVPRWRGASNGFAVRRLQIGGSRFGGGFLYFIVYG